MAVRAHTLRLPAIAALLLAFGTAAAAQDYPTRPVKIVVPFPPAALNDMVGRAIATSLTERLGKQFIVENRSGAGGTIGSELVANAPKDGYTLLIVSLAGAVNRWLYPLTFDPVKSFAPIASLVTTPAVVAVNPNLPAKSIKELVALAKEKPGGVQYASSGVGTFLHLAGELFKTVGRRRSPARPVQGRGPGDDRCHRRPLPGRLRLGRLDLAACAVRQAAGARRRRRHARPGAPRCSDRRGSRRAQLRGRQLDRHRGAGRHARARSSRSSTRKSRPRSIRPNCRSNSMPQARCRCG